MLIYTCKENSKCILKGDFNMTKKEICETNKAIGVCAISNVGGIAIHYIDELDEVVYFTIQTDHILSYNKAKIYYTLRDGNPYFKVGGHRYHLSDFMRV